MSAEEVVPVVDISPFFEYERNQNADLIKDLLVKWQRAFETIGFVIVTGHGVPENVCKDFQNDTVEFFTATKEEKSKVDMKKGYGKGGFVGLGGEVVGKTTIYNKKDLKCEMNGTLNENTEKPVPDYVETLEFLKGYDDDGDVTVVPKNPQSFETNLFSYWRCLRKFYQILFRISALALGLNEFYFNEYFQDPYERLRLAFYPAQDKRKPVQGQLRYGPHTDYACFAIVKSDDAPGGLEVLGKNENWIPVSWEPGSFIVNAGDLMQRWTNDCWRSVVHRVANPPAEYCNRHRLSLVLFVGPNRNVTIKPLETCCSEENPAKYKPIGCKEHLERKIKISSVKSS